MSSTSGFGLTDDVATLPPAARTPVKPGVCSDSKGDNPETAHTNRPALAATAFRADEARRCLLARRLGAHFVEVAVDSATAEVRVRRMLAVCASGRILNPKAARSQVIGAMTMGVGAALMEELVVDERVGLLRQSRSRIV